MSVTATIRRPAVFIGLGAAVFAALVGLVVREQVLRRAAQRIPAVAVDLGPERRRALEENVTTFSAAIERNAQDFNAHVELALAFTELGARDRAGEVYRQMNQRFPGNYLSFQNLGQLYEESEKYTLAAEQYLLAIQNAPKNPHVYRYLVNLYTYKDPSRAGDIPRILQQGLAQLPGSVDFMAMLAVYYRDHGEPREAIKWYEHLLVFDQSNTAAIEEVKQLKAKLQGSS